MQSKIWIQNESISRFGHAFQIMTVAVAHKAASSISLDKSSRTTIGRARLSARWLLSFAPGVGGCFWGMIACCSGCQFLLLKKKTF